MNVIVACCLSAVLVSGVSPYPTPGAVADSIEARLRRCLTEGPEARVEVERLASLTSLSWESGERVLDVDSPTSCGAGRRTFLVRIEGDHGLVRRPVSVDVRLSRLVLVTRHAADRDDVLAVSDVELEWRDVTFLRGRPYQIADAIAGMSPKRRMPEGTILTDLLVEPAPAVRPGEPVVIRYAGSGFEVRLEGVARERGHVGSRIRVKCVPSGRILTVTVTGEGQAEVS